MLLFFAGTLFLSAFLLFLVQPMVGKMILPTMGGAPAVWNTCMVFFQAALLAGYAYAHGTIAWLGVRRQAALHVALLLTPLLVLPITMNMSGVPTTQDNPVFWLLGRLLIGVGLPFFVVSTNAPLLQRWFSRTGHAEAHDPYFLYAASNLGSLLALLGYPIIVEPLLPLDDQSAAWAIAYGVMVVMAVGCAVIMWRSSASRFLETDNAITVEEKETRGSSEGLTLGRRIRWTVLAFVPSSLMLGVTTHVTTEIAPVPLLWVLPLALYLLSFVFVFARRTLIPHATMVRLFPFFIALTAVMTLQNERALGVFPLMLHLVTFFVTAMVCHGALANDRPRAEHLTEFYLILSIGGVLGGLFNAIVGPLLFNSILEYPLVMVLACLALGWQMRGPEQKARAYLDLVTPVVVTALTAALMYGLWVARLTEGQTTLLAVAVPTALCLLTMRRPVRFGLSLGGVMLVLTVSNWATSEKVLYTDRNFYGVKRVFSYGDDHFHVLAHGTTEHGIQSTHPLGRKIPRAYYHPTGPAGDIFRMYNSRNRPQPVALVGLGSGALAAYAKPGVEFDFYEIDPDVVRIAEDPDYFTYLADCEGDYRIVLGDARLRLREAPDGKYGLIVIDAFSSDAVPTHLLTREALQLYLSKLREDGVLAFHISNRYLNLAPLLANLAADAHVVCLMREDKADTKEAHDAAKLPSQYLVMARNMRSILHLEHNPEWKRPRTSPMVGVWTDQYTNMLALLRVGM